MTGPSWFPAAGVAAAVAVSPLLASWTAALAAGPPTAWWRPRTVRAARWVTVTAVAAALVAVAGAGTPAVAWWLFAAGGAVLAVVDVQTHRLPARFVYPLGAAVGVALTVAAAPAGAFGALLRAAAAAAVVGGGYLAVRFLSPPAMGLGDVRLAAVAGGLLGYTGWSAVWQAQLLTALLGGVTAITLRAARPGRPGRRGEVPMGPAIVLGALLTGWL